MILVTVGAQMAFDRLIRSVDQWAASQRRQDIFAQVGPASYEPRHIRWVRFLEPMAFRAQVAQASAVVAHAGMGSIITALELGKPILVMPRRGDLRETRNDHQLDTARHFLAQGRISVAFDEQELVEKLEELDRLTAAVPVTPKASPELLRTLRRFVERGAVSCPQTRFDGVVTLGRIGLDTSDERLFGHVPDLRVALELRNRSRLDSLAGVFPGGVRTVVQAGAAARIGPLVVSLRHRQNFRAARQIRAALRQLGIRLPLLWTGEPEAAGLVQQVPHAALVYHRDGPIPKGIERANDRWLKAHADLTLFSSYLPFEAESAECHRPRLLADLESGEPGVGLAAILSDVLSDLHPVSKSATGAPARAGRTVKAGPVQKACREERMVTVPAQTRIHFSDEVKPAMRVPPVRSVILLAGSVRPTRFQTAIGRSVMELPLQHDQTLLEHWIQGVSGLAHASDVERMELRLLADRAAPNPKHKYRSNVALRLEHDPSELRGTGGILRDLAGDYHDDDLLLVAGGAQYLLRPLAAIVSELAEAKADVTIASHQDGTPASLMLIRCGCLRLLPTVGFVDLKEQGLPLIAREHRVVVRSYEHWTGIPVRTQSQYVSALRHHHRQSMGPAGAFNAFEEDWELRFRIIEPGARVQDGAVIHDSVVLAGATVGRNATVVRSVVCPGVRVRRGSTVADTVMGAA